MHDEPPSQPSIADHPLPGDLERPLPGDVERTALPERVVTYWRISSAFTWLFLIAIPIGLALSIPGLPTPVRILLGTAPLVAAIAEIAIVPPRRRATWWYAVGDEQIDLQHGWPVVTRTVIPITRVQHVELQQGPLAQRFQLAQLSIHTAAGAVKIPALDRAEGEQIRQRIADLARVADDL